MKTKIWIYTIAIIIILAIIVYVFFRTKRPITDSSLPPVPVDQIISSSTPSGISTTTPTSTPTQFVPPLSLNVYNDPQYKYKLLYSSDFGLKTSSNAMAAADCQQGARTCFALNPDLYKNTNFVSANVDISILNNKTTIEQCANMTPDEINGGQMTGGISINGVNFITAQSNGAGAGNFYQEHYYRAWYGTFCIEMDARVHSANAANYDPPRPEFDAGDVWYKLQVLINSFQFNK